MATASVELIKQLRDRTGAGLMDCKHALEENDLNVDKACDWLREKGLAKAAKKADRIAAEGLAYVKTCEGCGRTVLTEVNCETDFVSKGDAFREFVDGIAKVILHNNPATLDEAKAACADLFTDATVKMGEKFDLRRYTVFEKGDNAVYSYVHMGGKIGVVVVLAKEDAELGKGLAMHIAANNPQYLGKEDIDPAVIAHETEVQMNTAKNDPKLAGKPEAMLTKIIEGKVNKYFAEMLLSEQIYLLDEEQTKKVGQVLAEKGNKVVKFVRYQVGEGIEKRQDDFASEVMGQMK